MSYKTIPGLHGELLDVNELKFWDVFDYKFSFSSPSNHTNVFYEESTGRNAGIGLVKLAGDGYQGTATYSLSANIPESKSIKAFRFLPVTSDALLLIYKTRKQIVLQQLPLDTFVQAKQGG